MSRSHADRDGKLVQKLYDQRPYPRAKENASLGKRWSLPPMEWINALWKPGREVTAPERILVAGCGTGTEAFAMRRRFPNSEIVAVDFSPRSIDIADDIQRHTPARRKIRFLVADLTRQDFTRIVGREFDFVSCHGVLSYISRPEIVLQNLARSLKADGALYLGVNGAHHASATARRALPAFGIDPSEMPGEKRARSVMGTFDAILGNVKDARLSKLPTELVACDLFGPLIRNLPLADWVTMALEGGLHFQGTYETWRAMRKAFQDKVSELIPLSRAETCSLAAILFSVGFHRALFTRQPVSNPPWNDLPALLDWHPVWTGMYSSRLPKQSIARRGTQAVTLRSPKTNTALEWQMPNWELELLRQCDGRQSLGALLPHRRTKVSPKAIQQQLYILHHLLVISMMPGVGSGAR